MVMDIYYNELYECWTHKETGQTARSKTQLCAKIKRFRLGIPMHPFLSHRFIINNIKDVHDQND